MQRGGCEATASRPLVWLLVLMKQPSTQLLKMAPSFDVRLTREACLLNHT